MLVIGIYARQSVDRKDSISIESQIEFCRAEINRFKTALQSQKSDVSSVKIRVYTDKGFSGKNTNRPEFQELLKDVENGLIKRIICYKLDRFSRNLSDFIKTNETLEKYGVKFVSCTESFDTGTPMGRAMLSIAMVFAQMERETIQERVRDNYYKRAEKGLFLGGNTPFGYEKLPENIDGIKTSKFIPKEPENAIVELIFELFANEEKGIAEIAEILNTKHKIKTFNTCFISFLLRNPIYTPASEKIAEYLRRKGAVINADFSDYKGENSLFVYGSSKARKGRKFAHIDGENAVLSTFIGIVTNEIWLLAQRRLDRFQDKYGKSQIAQKRLNSRKTWLSGMLKCGYCGLAMSPVSGKNAVYFTCGGRKNKHCYERKKPVLIAKIERNTEIKLLEYMADFRFSEISHENSKNDMQKELETALKTLCNRKNELLEQAMLFKSADAWNLIKMINSKISEIDTQIAEITDKIAENEHLSSSIKRKCINSEILDSYRENWHNYDIMTKHKIAIIFIERAVLTDDTLEIIWKC